jgi:glycosyltransferase involved in cell wall biosynthesis
MVGRLVHEKGYQYMLQALEILSFSNIKFHLKIFGDGVLKQEIQNDIKQRGLSGEITIVPTVSHADLFKVVYQADIFVMSSVSEGFPMAPAEAMVLGVPVVATKVGGIPELIEDGVSGVLVPAKNAKMLANAIKEVLLDHNLRNSLSSNGKKRINENFSPTIICQKLVDYYEKVLKS